MTQSRKRIRWLVGLIVAATLTTQPSMSADTPTDHNGRPVGAAPKRPAGAKPKQPAPINVTSREVTYDKLPLTFEVNRGQMAGSVDYLVRGIGYNLYLRPQGAVLALETGPQGPARTLSLNVDDVLDRFSRKPESRIHMKIVDANPDAPATGLDPLPSKTHYFTGSDPSHWHTGVPHFSKVSYREVYPGIDLVYYGRQGQLEYDFVVAPNADPDAITLAFHGSDNIEVNGDGSLSIETGGGRLRLEEPVVYSVLENGLHRRTSAEYVINKIGEVHFRVSSYDPSLPLVIDPILSYASYLGGAGQDASLAMSVDDSGNAYVTGVTNSLDFPAGGAKGFVGGGTYGADGFVTKLNADGTAVFYTAFFGGGDDDIGLGITTDAAGNAYVTGATRSTDFPTAGPAQAAFAGGGPIFNTDAFVLKLNADGSQLVYSTYLGGSGNDGGRGIAIDSGGAAYVSGVTTSTDFPIVAEFQAANAGGSRFGADAFVTKVAADGSAFVYSTYLGGSEDDVGSAIAVDAAGLAHVTGLTYSADFPTAGPIQAPYGTFADVFVSKFDAAGALLLYSTHLGGSENDFGLGIALDSTGDAYVTGLTRSADYPTLLPAQAFFGSVDGGGADAFVSKIQSDGVQLLYSTLLGGSGPDRALAITVDDAGSAYIAGETFSRDLITVNAVQPNYGGKRDAMVAKLNPAGTEFEFVTYLGGSEDDMGSGIAENGGNTFVSLSSRSLEGPVTFDAFQTSNAGEADSIVARISAGDAPPTISTILSASGTQLVAPGSIASGFAPVVAGGTLAATTQPLPTELLGVSLRVTDSAGVPRLTPLFVVTPNQANYFVDDATAPGLALVEVLQDGQVIATGTIQVIAVSPGIFTANADGKGVPAALFLRFELGVQTANELTFDPGQALGLRDPLLLDLGGESESAFVAIFGTGMRNGATVTATLDGEDVPVTAIFPAEGFVGLDQTNVGPIPRSFIGRGIVRLTIFVDGRPTNNVFLRF